MFELDKPLAGIETYVVSPSRTTRLLCMNLTLSRHGKGFAVRPCTIAYPGGKSGWADWLERVERLPLRLEGLRLNPFALEEAFPFRPQPARLKKVAGHYKKVCQALFTKVPWAAEPEVTLLGLFTLLASGQTHMWRFRRRITAYDDTP
jgi:hypothetical protein